MCKAKTQWAECIHFVHDRDRFLFLFVLLFFLSDFSILTNRSENAVRFVRIQSGEKKKEESVQRAANTSSHNRWVNRIEKIERKKRETVDANNERTIE